MRGRSSGCRFGGRAPWSETVPEGAPVLCGTNVRLDIRGPGPKLRPAVLPAPREVLRSRGRGASRTDVVGQVIEQHDAFDAPLLFHRADLPVGELGLPVVEVAQEGMELPVDQQIEQSIGRLPGQRLVAAPADRQPHRALRNGHAARGPKATSVFAGEETQLGGPERCALERCLVENLTGDAKGAIDHHATASTHGTGGAAVEAVSDLAVAARVARSAVAQRRDPRKIEVDS